MPLSFAHASIRLEMAIAGYQFPHVTVGEWDSNWLDVDVKLDCGHKHFRRVDACLTTFELDRLRRWFEAMATEPREDVPEDFTEPNLTFVLSSIDPLTLTVTLDLELIPPWESQPLELAFPITREQLIASTQSLREMLAEFPRR